MATDNRKNLLIGSTSQLAYFWNDEDTEIISSRNIDIQWIKSQKWDRIYLAFTDGRTFLRDWKHFSSFYDTNVSYTLNLINELKGCCNNLIYYSTTELWNHHNGPIDLTTPFNFDMESPYIRSKVIITKELLREEKKYSNVIILFPFSFNSAIRKEKDFLFSKVFQSLINKEEITIGNTYFYRELLHPKFVILKSQTANSHQIIGSGRLVFVNDFIRDLYGVYNLKYDEFVKEDEGKAINRSTFYLNSKKCLYTYRQLYKDTITDLFVGKRGKK